MYNKIISHFLTYGWSWMLDNDRNRLQKFSTFWKRNSEEESLIKNENECTRKSNEEVYELLKDNEIITSIKISRPR